MSSQTNPHSMQNPGSEKSSDQTYGRGSVSNYRNPSVPAADSKPGSDAAQCYNCGLLGHYGRDCKKPKRREVGSMGRGTNRYRPGKPENPTTKPDPGAVKVLNLPIKYEEKRILEVQLGTRKILALLDSGCEQSVIGRSLIRKVPLEPTSEKLSTADGIDVPLLGETTIEFLVSGFQSQCRVVVSEAIDELILGIEWLQTNQCVWDFGSNSFAIEGHKGRLRCKKASKAVRRILVQDEIEISGWYSQEVPVLISRASLNNEKQNWGGSSRMADSDLLIASAIYDSADVQSVCQVVNMSDLPQRLRKGSELGEAEPVEILELNKQSESTIEKSWSRRSFIKSQKNCRIRKFLWNRGV